MRKLLLAAALAAASGAALAGPNVGISLNVVQPGMYGQVVIGNAAPPPVVYAQPVIVAPPPVAVVEPPMYLYVPVAYQQNWGYYCGRYAACGRPVYFVQEQWVQSRPQRGYERHGRGHRRHEDD